MKMIIRAVGDRNQVTLVHERETLPKDVAPLEVTYSKKYKEELISKINATSMSMTEKVRAITKVRLVGGTK